MCRDCAALNLEIRSQRRRRLAGEQGWPGQDREPRETELLPARRERTITPQAPRDSPPALPEFAKAPEPGFPKRESEKFLWDYFGERDVD